MIRQNPWLSIRALMNSGTVGLVSVRVRSGVMSQVIAASRRYVELCGRTLRLAYGSPLMTRAEGKTKETIDGGGDVPLLASRG